MDGIIYKFKNKINGKIYIGQTINEKNRYRDHKYCYTESVFHRAIKKYGFENFDYQVIETDDVGLLDEREIYWISLYRSNESEFGYNITDGGEGTRGRKMSDYNKQKLLEYKLGKHLSDETKQKISESQNGKHLTEETRIKLSEIKMGHETSDETRQKISESNKGKVRSDETRQRLSESLKGRPSPNKGKHLTEETKLKLSESHKGSHWKLENGVRVWYR